MKATESYAMANGTFAALADLDEYYGAPIPGPFRSCAFFCRSQAVGVICGRIAELAPELGPMNWAPEHSEFMQWLQEQLGCEINVAIPVCKIHHDEAEVVAQ